MSKIQEYINNSNVGKQPTLQQVEKLIADYSSMTNQELAEKYNKLKQSAPIVGEPIDGYRSIGTFISRMNDITMHQKVTNTKLELLANACRSISYSIYIIGFSTVVALFLIYLSNG